MKCAAFYTLALACCLGLVLADNYESFSGMGGFGGMGGLGGMSGFGGMGGYGAGYGGATYVPVMAGGQRGGAGFGGNGSFIGLIGLLFLLMILFGSGSSSNADQIILLNSTLEG